ncbi:MAG: hypothetical protein H0X24_19290 [Ktedonobacterales bacterium]|nr:hypothetical protein [Ktedonobacterales bacterium]
MTTIQPTKPVLSAIVAALWLGAFVFFDPGPNGFFTQTLHLNPAEANAWKLGLIFVFGLLWTLVMIFFDAPGTASRLSLALSGTILWLGLLLFFHFDDPGYGGTVAFFALVGGLVIVITWIRYLADEI